MTGVGLTVVHVNRVLRRFREEGMATVAKARVKILDFQSSWDLPTFYSTYLNATPPEYPKLTLV